MNRDTLEELIENTHIQNEDKLQLLKVEYTNVSFKSGYYLGYLKYIESQIDKINHQGENKKDS